MSSLSILEISNRIPSMRLCYICNETIHKNSVDNHIKTIKHNINILLEDFKEHFTDAQTAREFVQNHRELCETDEVIRYIHIRRLLEVSR